jgi:hypothetical protein
MADLKKKTAGWIDLEEMKLYILENSIFSPFLKWFFYPVLSI